MGGISVADDSNSAHSCLLTNIVDWNALISILPNGSSRFIMRCCAMMLLME